MTLFMLERRKKKKNLAFCWFGKGLYTKNKFKKKKIEKQKEVCSCTHTSVHNIVNLEFV